MNDDEMRKTLKPCPFCGGVREALKRIVALSIVDTSCSLEAQGWTELEIERHSGRCDAAEIAREALAALGDGGGV